MGNQAQPYTLVTLLNAYNNDVYYEITTCLPSGIIVQEKGCKKIDQVLDTTLTDKPVLFIGNGAQLHQALIDTRFVNKLQIAPISTCSAQSVGHLAYNQFKENPDILTYQIEPNYIKSQNFAIRNVTL